MGAQVGEFWEECPRCHGAGKLECDDQSEMVNTTQYYRCPGCEGTGRMPDNQKMATTKPCTCHDCRLQARRERLEALATDRQRILATIDDEDELDRLLTENAAKMRALVEG